MGNFNVVFGPACSILMSFPVSVPSWSILVSFSWPVVNFNKPGLTLGCFQGSFSPAAVSAEPQLMADVMVLGGVGI